MDNPPPAATPSRRRLSLRAELGLALTATVPVLAVFGVLEHLSRQHILYASIASSALSIYSDPLHRSNQPRTILQSQALATVIGLATFLLFGHNYLAAGSALVLTVLVCVVLTDCTRPPSRRPWRSPFDPERSAPCSSSRWPWASPLGWSGSNERCSGCWPGSTATA